MPDDYRRKNIVSGICNAGVPESETFVRFPRNRWYELESSESRSCM